MDYLAIAEQAPAKSFLDIAEAAPMKKREAEIRAAPKPTFGENVKNLLRQQGIFYKTPEEEVAQAQNTYALQKSIEKETAETGRPQEEVAQKYLSVFKKDPTYLQLLSAPIMGTVAAGFLSHPLLTSLGVVGFAGLSELENLAVSKIKQSPYLFGAGKGVRELLPEDVNEATKEFVDVLDFIGKGLILGGVKKKAPEIGQKFTKNILTEYKMPRDVYISPEKVAGVFNPARGPITSEELDLVQSLGLSGGQYKNALNAGVNIRVPAEKVTTIVDKPYWAKIKDVFRIPPFREVRTLPAGKTAAVPSALLPAPAAITVPPDMIAKSWTTTDFQQLPINQQQAILAGKLETAKSAAHRQSIEEKYKVVEPTEEKVLGLTKEQIREELQKKGFPRLVGEEPIGEGKITAVVPTELISTIQKEVFKPSPPMDNKPGGVWLSVNDSWERWLKSEQPDWLKGKKSVDVTIKSGAKLLEINSLEDLKNVYTKYGIPFERRNYKMQLLFDKIKADGYDGIKYTETNQLRLDSPMYGWDADSIVIFDAKNVKVKQLSQPTGEGKVISEETVSKIVSKYPQHIVDQKSLEEVGDKIAMEMGIKHPITWRYHKSSKMGHGATIRVPRGLGRIYINLSVGPSGTRESLAEAAIARGVEPERAWKGKGTPVAVWSSSQGAIKTAIVHELVHALPGFRELSSREQHKKGFYDRLAEERMMRLFDVEYRNVKTKPSEFKTPLTDHDTPSSNVIKSTSPNPQPTKLEKPKPITTWHVEDFPDDALINKSDADTVRTISSINDGIRNGMLKTVEDYKKGKNPYTLNHIIDTPIAFQRLEEKTGFPLYTKYGVEASKARNIIAYEVATIINRFTDGLQKGYQTAGSTERIVNYIVKQEGRLNDEERKIATKLMDIFRDTKDIVSYLRMRRFIDGAEQVPKDLEAIVEEGEKVYVKGGKEALEKWVKGREIGVVTDDRYFPAQLLRKFRTHNSTDPFEVFNPHVHSRTVEEQMYDYSQSIVQKLHSYLTRMYSDYYLYDLLVDAKNDFSQTDMPYDTISSIKKWLVAIQGKGVEVGWWGQVARKARGQFFKVVLAEPTKWVRNYLQRYYMTLQNYPTLQHAMRTKQYFDYKLTVPELDFFCKHISQLRELEREQLYLYEKVFEHGVLGKVDDLATALAHRYTLVDEGNRYVTFKYALASNDLYLKLYKQGKLGLRGMMNKTGMSSFYPLEIKHILSLPVDEARLEIAKQLVDKTQFRYKKTERGLSALSEFGEIATSLLQYPKSVITRYLDSVDMITRGEGIEEKWAGVRLLVGLILLSAVAQNVLEHIVGESKYYDPDLGREVVNDPYSLISVIGSLQIAGAQPGHAVTLARLAKRISDLLYLDSTKQMPSDSYRMTAIRAILKDVDQLGESYIPFIKIAMNGVEAAEGTRSHKLLTMWFDQKTRRQTALRRNKIQRNWVEAWQHFFFGLERKGRKEEKGLWR